MGKFSNVLSAKITGNVGAMSFREKDGEIVAAQRSYTNKSKGDGASYAQREHRARLSNVVNVFKQIALIEKRGWENKLPNQSDFNMFTKQNLSVSPIFLSKQEAELGAAVAAPYAASRGALSVIPCSYVGLNSTIFKLGLNFGADTVDWDSLTIGQFSTRIIENNEGWQANDKLSICVLVQIERMVAGISIPQLEVRYLEITLDPSSDTLINGSFNWDIVQLDVDNNHILQCLDGGDAAFAIHSREAAGHLETSSQNILLKNPGSKDYAKYSSGAQKLVAMQSYGFKDVVLLDPNSENTVANVNGATIDSCYLYYNDAEILPEYGQRFKLNNEIPFTVNGVGLIYGENIRFEADFGTEWVLLDESTGVTVNARLLDYDITTEGHFRLIVNGVEMLNFIVYTE